MKKLISLFIISFLVISSVGCNKTMDNIIEEEVSITGIVTEVYDNSFLLHTEKADGYPSPTDWNVPLEAENSDSYLDINVGDEVVVYYDGQAGETYPLQIFTVYGITLKTPAERIENTETTEVTDKWGITLSTKDITSEGLTLVISQHGGEPTGEILYGSDWSLEKLTEERNWEAVAFIIDDSNIGWTSEAYMLSPNSTNEQKINWEVFHDSLPEGKYRVAKSIMDFRKTADFDTQTYYAEFEIK